MTLRSGSAFHAGMNARWTYSRTQSSASGRSGVSWGALLGVPIGLKMKQRSQKKIAAKEEKCRKHRRTVEIVREATRKALSTPNASGEGREV